MVLSRSDFSLAAAVYICLLSICSIPTLIPWFCSRSDYSLGDAVYICLFAESDCLYHDVVPEVTVALQLQHIIVCSLFAAFIACTMVLFQKQLYPCSYSIYLSVIYLQRPMLVPWCCSRSDVALQLQHILVYCLSVVSDTCTMVLCQKWLQSCSCSVYSVVYLQCPTACTMVLFQKQLNLAAISYTCLYCSCRVYLSVVYLLDQIAESLWQWIEKDTIYFEIFVNVRNENHYNLETLCNPKKWSTPSLAEDSIDLH